MSDVLQGYLKARRSVPAPFLGEPAPDGETLRKLLAIATRVPDHGKLAPWRFIVYGREAREAALPKLLQIAETAADEKDRRNRADKARAFAASPLIVAVVSAPVVDHPKIPLWEQQLSAGAVCLNLLHAANAHGFAAQWLTGWCAYDQAALALLGLREGERVAGFIHIGTTDVPGTERDRPDVDALTTMWNAPEG
jgi:nitroreductase